MALRFLEGFDVYGATGTSTADIMARLSGKWDGIQPDTSSGFALVTGAQSSGVALDLHSTQGALLKNIGNQQEWWIGLFVKFVDVNSSDSQFLCLYDGTSLQIELEIEGGVTNNRKMKLYAAGSLQGYSTTVFAADTWYYLELYTKIQNDSSGAYELRVNGVNELSGSVDTSASGNNYAQTIRFSMYSGEVYLDDIYILDGQSGLTGFQGPCKVSVIYPSGDKSPSTWTPSTGSDHYVLLDEAVRDTADYIYTDVNGNEDIFSFPSAGFTTIKGIQLCVEAASSGNEIKEFAGIIRDGANETTSQKKIYGGDIPDVILVTAEYVPGTSTTWTPSDISAASFGCEKVS